MEALKFTRMLLAAECLALLLRRGLNPARGLLYTSKETNIPLAYDLASACIRLACSLALEQAKGGFSLRSEHARRKAALALDRRLSQVRRGLRELAHALALYYTSQGELSWVVE